MSTLFVFLQTVPQGGPKWSSYIFIILLIVIFWLFIIRPKKRKTKKRNRFLNSPGQKASPISLTVIWNDRHHMHFLFVRHAAQS